MVHVIERAGILRRRAALLAELAQLDLELAALEDQEPARKPAARKRRAVVAAPPVPVAPAQPPTDIDRARARRELARVGCLPTTR